MSTKGRCLRPLRYLPICRPYNFCGIFKQLLCAWAISPHQSQAVAWQLIISHCIKWHGFSLFCKNVIQWVKIVGYAWLADRIRLFVYYTISFSSLCKLIWRHWTYKMSVRYILSSVWVRLSKFPVIHYMKLCVFSLPISLVMIARIYLYILCLIIIIESEVWTILYDLWLGHETTVCLSIF